VSAKMVSGLFDYLGFSRDLAGKSLVQKKKWKSAFTKSFWFLYEKRKVHWLNHWTHFGV